MPIILSWILDTNNRHIKVNFSHLVWKANLTNLQQLSRSIDDEKQHPAQSKF